MTKIIFLSLLLSISVYAQETTTPSEDVMFDPTSEVDEPLPVADGTTETVSPEPAPADAVVSEPVETETTFPADEPAMTDATPEPRKEAIPAAESPNVTTPENASPSVAPMTAQSETPVMSTEIDDEDKKFNPLKSHWITTFGFEGLKYEVPWQYSGVKKNFRPGEMELWGGRLGFGGEIHLGAGIMATTKVEGYYVGTLFSRALNAGPNDEDEEFSYVKRTGQVYGADVTQALGFMFDFKTKNPFMDEWSYLTVEPFVEVGIGVARAYARVNYDYNLGNVGVNEGYRSRIRDELTNARFGGGVNFTSSEGFFLYLKAYVNTFDITQRKTDTIQRADQGPTVDTPTVTDKNVKIDPITTYALGGGYKF